MILSGSSAWFGSSLTFIDTKSIEQTSIMLCLFFFFYFQDEHELMGKNSSAKSGKDYPTLGIVIMESVICLKPNANLIRFKSLNNQVHCN